MEFLPVYTPSEAERENAYLYADNVRSVMAEALNVRSYNVISSGGSTDSSATSLVLL